MLKEYHMLALPPEEREEMWARQMVEAHGQLIEVSQSTFAIF